MTTYVPTYLSSVERQEDGYPKAVTHEQKLELESMIRELLIKHKHLSMTQVEWMLNDKASCLKESCLWDYTYACIDRALRAVAQPVFELSDIEKYKLQHECRQKKLKLLPLKYEDIKSNERDREPGERKEWSYSNAFCSAFPALFGDCDSNYEVCDVLVKAGVLSKRNKFDAETCCLYLFFGSEKAAHAFVDRFNKWALEQLPERKAEFVRLLKAK